MYNDNDDYMASASKHINSKVMDGITKNYFACHSTLLHKTIALRSTHSGRHIVTQTQQCSHLNSLIQNNYTIT